MNCDSDIKQNVLRGVYEDNLGVPRTGARKSRARWRVVAPNNHVEPGTTGRRWPRVALSGILALFGVSFSFPLAPVGDDVNITRQAAVQVVPDEGISLWNLAPAPWASFKGPIVLDPGPAPDSGLLLDTRVSPEDQAEQYGLLLSQIDVPVADLFGLKVQTIVIDPGHGGIDPGATGPTGVKEKDVALDIARRLHDKLSRTGRYSVLLTRDEDKKVFLKERVAFAKKHQADLFISIHANSLPVENRNYVETYFFGPHAGQESLDLAEKENRDSDYAMGDFREIIAKIGDTLKTEESQGLAKSIHKHLYSNMKRHNESLVDAGTKAGPFVVLLGVEVPSVLVEVSCLSNKAEEKRLDTPDYRHKIAGFLERGIVAYLDGRAYKNAIVGGQIQDVAKHQR